MARTAAEGEHFGPWPGSKSTVMIGDTATASLWGDGPACPRCGFTTRIHPTLPSRCSKCGPLPTTADRKALADEHLERSKSSRQGCWAAAMPAAQFVTQEDAELDFFEPAQLAPGCVTIWYSPRGLGKTPAAHATLIRQVRLGRRVLLIDRDNSPREVRRRLRGWGVHGTSGLDLLTREKAPPLTDSKQWTSFPFGDYEIVCIDALDSATEGVGEQDSAKVSRALASILDLARREAGPAMLLLGNAV